MQASVCVCSNLIFDQVSLPFQYHLHIRRHWTYWGQPSLPINQSFSLRANELLYCPSDYYPCSIWKRKHFIFFILFPNPTFQGLSVFKEQKRDEPTQLQPCFFLLSGERKRPLLHFRLIRVLFRDLGIRLNPCSDIYCPDDTAYFIKPGYASVSSSPMIILHCWFIIRIKLDHNCKAFSTWPGT